MSFKLALDISLSGGVLGSGGGKPTALRNVGSRGALHNSQTAANGAKTWFAGRWPEIVQQPSTSLSVLYGNWWLANATASEVGAADTLILQEVALEYNGHVVELTFGGSSSHTMASGANDVAWDEVPASAFGLSVIPQGAVVFVRTLGTYGVGNMPAYSNRLLLSGEQTFRFDRSTNLTYSVAGQATGVLTTPTGADTNAGIHTPQALLGRIDATKPSWVLIGDSILDNNADRVGNGQNGGGWGSRGCFSSSVPCFKFTINGHRAQYYASNHALRSALLKYVSRGVCGLGINDVANGRTFAQIVADLATVSNDLNTQGLTKIYQALISMISFSTDLWTTTVNQTLSAPMQAGGIKEQVNTQLLASVGTNHLTGIFDQPSFVADGTVPQKFGSRAYSSTLSAAILAGVTTIPLTAQPTVDEMLAIDAGSGALQETALNTFVNTTSPTVIQTATALGHLINAPVKGTETVDGTHYSPVIHKAAGVGFASLVAAAG